MMGLKVHRFLDFATHCQNVLVLDSQCLLFHVIIQPFIFCSTSQETDLNEPTKLPCPVFWLDLPMKALADQKQENRQVEILFFPNLSLWGHSLERQLYSSTNSCIFNQTVSLLYLQFLLCWLLQSPFSFKLRVVITSRHCESWELFWFP